MPDLTRELIAPKPPAWLSKSACVEWRRLSGLAYNLGKLRVETTRSFALLCEVLAQADAARQTIEAEGLTVAAGNGGTKAHPALRVGEAARKEAVRLLAQFGLSPASATPYPGEAPKGGLEAVAHLNDRFVDWGEPGSGAA